VSVIAADSFNNFQPGLQPPVRKSFAITKDDVNELPFVTRATYVGGTGDLTLRLAHDAGRTSEAR
jgi:hypothetical protein